MITPSFALTATERVLPNLALDFTTAVLDSRVTFTRTGNTATVTNSSGNIVGINANLPRFDYNPTTLVCKGLLIEEARTNVLVNSLINGTNLTTQIVTTTAVAYTLSFYGTGNIVLSGTSSSTQTGSGAYPSRKTYTFTPTAGALTLTVSGTVQYAQLEVGAFATSFIPTTTATTRNNDVATMTGTNFSSWYNASAGALTVWFDTNATGPGGVFSINNGSSAQRIDYRAGTASGYVFVNGNLAMYLGIPTKGILRKACVAIKNADFAGQVTGGTFRTSADAIPTGLSTLNIGSLDSAANFVNGHIANIFYYPQRLINAEVQAQVRI
jgi:hypothetical protein